MTGYQEVLTDPSYAGQMGCMTYPLQGNYGVRDADAESSRPWARALIVRWACPQPSHHSSEASLDEYLKRWRVPPISAQDLVAETSRTATEEWLDPLPPELRPGHKADGTGLAIAVVDYGVKLNILRSLRERGCRVIVLPHTVTWSDVAAAGVDGLVLANGPGDPAGRFLRIAAQPQRRLGRRPRPPHAASVQRAVPPRGLSRAAGQPAPLRPIPGDGARPAPGSQGGRWRGADGAAEEGFDPRLGTDRDRPGRGVRLRRHAGVQGAARRRHHDRPRQLQPGDDHDRRRGGRPRIPRASDRGSGGARDRS